jgi:nucleoside-diphosphate-sugar epimerase
VDAVIINPGVILGPGFWKSGGSGSLFTSIYNGLRYYPEGSTAYVDVWDVVSAMQQLMMSSIKNESFILIAKNQSIQIFQETVAAALNVKKPNKKASPFLLAVAWRLDWLNHKVFGKRRKLSRHMANSITSETLYDNSKIKEALGFEFTGLQDSIKTVGSYFLKDFKKTH